MPFWMTSVLLEDLADANLRVRYSAVLVNFGV